MRPNLNSEEEETGVEKINGSSQPSSKRKAIAVESSPESTGSSTWKQVEGKRTKLIEKLAEEISSLNRQNAALRGQLQILAKRMEHMARELQELRANPPPPHPPAASTPPPAAPIGNLASTANEPRDKEVEQISETVKSSIISFCDEGLSCREISHQLGIRYHYHTVNKYRRIRAPTF
ncbi:uncharacterized protein VTP21DRAFT_10260 [Calcarisporiella thermophila]|uniref:uncharacterized protein n=1 Tax=Calcarisporiella thermophila TaxID=911321 RepID=UPI003743073B